MREKPWGMLIVCGVFLLFGTIGDAFGEPIADAGPDQIVFEEVILDGSQSTDDEGNIVLYEWLLIHKDNPSINMKRFGIDPVAIFSNLTPGFYTVVLTVTNDLQEKKSDVMNLAAAGRWVLTPKINDIIPIDLQPGDVVNISGENFGDTQPDDASVFMGKKSLKIISWTDTEIQATVKEYKCDWFKGKESKDQKIHVKVSWVQSNKKKLTVNKPLDCLN